MVFELEFGSKQKFCLIGKNDNGEIHVITDVVDLYDAIGLAEQMSEDYDFEKITITDPTTGELHVTVRRSSDEDDCDWGYNEDEGFDPYAGCYTYDC